MKIFKKIGLVCLASITFGGAANATTINTSHILTDNYIGGGSSRDAIHGNLASNDPNNNYNTHSLEYVINGDWLTVLIDSNFAGNADPYNYGDLFIMDGANYTTPANNGIDERSVRWQTNNDRYVAHGTNVSDNRWEYAFDLLSEFGGNRANSQDEFSGEVGVLREIDTNGSANYASQLILSNHYNGDKGNAGRSRQAILVGNNTDYVGGSNNPNLGNWGASNSQNLITFNINIANTPLLTANSLAFRWAMTCANDIIEGVAQAKTPKPVPEPQTLLLMFAAIAGLVIRKKAQAK